MINTFFLIVLVGFITLYFYLHLGIKAVLIVYLAALILWSLIYLIKFFIENYRRSKDEKDDSDEE